MGEKEDESKSGSTIDFNTEIENKYNKNQMGSAPNVTHKTTLCHLLNFVIPQNVVPFAKLSLL